MSWGKLLQPDVVLGGPITTLTPALLERHGLKGLILDVDETLVPVSLKQASDELTQWLEQIRPVASIWLVSNNISRTRIGGIAASLRLPYLVGARKPSRRKLREAASSMNMPIEQIAMVGDRLFTDVLAGNRLGMFTILVDPMVNPSQTNKRYPVHAAEVWVSQILGASLAPWQE
ncbi:MAG: YqeG family HAD IIIA-type phosphatase [Kaiparowitsia implicata GSE-PSE-MK54-09C]|jgi:HAD superfamily phosphatase (TIGR01668 family)|nr:YqeG family HAD IIIA-type phosphatase [Kaiparowitsia implicata GSE-PSE-MK54-09C]